MTLLKPIIALRRLCIYKDNRVVFDAAFHNGVNIIRGHNSSGKTTILDFIAYTLGAEYVPWKQEALLCDWSIAEVSLNGRAITLRRAVNDKPLNPMYIYWGPFEEANAAPATSWELFGFRRSASKLSFTQALLLAMDLPEAQGDGASNLTMHQLLRVLYADQPSLHSPIFRSDAFDSALNRETIGAYLSGVYDDGLYVAQLEKRGLEKEGQQLDAELKSIFTVLAKSEQNANFEFLGQEITNLERVRDKAVEDLKQLRTERTVTADLKKATGEENLRSQLDSAKKALSDAQDRISRGELDVADSRKFVEELELRLRNLDESSTTRNYFGKLAFAFCPCCLSELKTPAKESSECALCKSELNAPAADAQVLRMRNELRIQLNESVGLIAEREAELRREHSLVPALRQELKALERRYAESAQVWSSDLESAIELAARRIGALEQEIKGLYENQRLAETIRQLQVRRESIGIRLSELDSKIESLIFTQEVRKQRVQHEVAATLGRLLREDLNRQAEFARAENIQFSFTDNVVSVEGSTQFSESSTVVLRHLFHLALLSASTRMPEMRFPRFLILDGIEDGGMELERSYRLQEIIVNECNRFECDYQVIFATSQISPALENDAYVVARQFSENSRSLAIL
ncbi:AAA domain protein [Burkholderia sp. MSHR3999]|uniref:ATP-binding protein n=1 Tax=Burkholderia sp. MSHR3999 TaxID=1542965 RepID=UPI0005AC4D08|nr:ATP-binding protein [Burkholderia sp. MSHR3999]KIP16006.1 AAA domain protein [Burkholderia sp. MSHR3999]